MTRKSSERGKTRKTFESSKKSEVDNVLHVKGRITNIQDGSGLPGLRVEVFQKAEPISQPIGMAETDLDGSYTIPYTAETTISADKRSADLLVRVLDSNGVEIGTSTILYDVPKEVTFDLAIASLAESKPSEYQKLVDVLHPLLQNRPIGNLTDSDISLLTDEIGVDRQKVEFLVSAHRLSTDTGLPAETFYATARQDLGTDLRSILAGNPADLHAALETSIKHKIISAGMLDRVTAITDKLASLRADQTPVIELAQLSLIQPPPELLGYLRERSIRTLADIRDAGGISHFEDLPVTVDNPVVRNLEAHARLSLLPTNPASNAQLIEHGFGTLAEIADTPRQTFVAVVEKVMPAVTAERVHEMATLQARYIGSVLADMRTRIAKGQAQTISSSQESALSGDCDCEDCENATSPIAYLVDLLDYAILHLKYQGGPVNLTQLEAHFHQPLRNLPSTCEQMDRQVPQVRICIEVLRSYLPAQYANSTSQGYLEIAYLMLLERMGTSFDELRRARAWPRVQIERLFTRLGIYVHPQQKPLDLLNEILRDPSDPTQLTEEFLEDRFGLRDTRRAPLESDAEGGILGLRLLYLRRVIWQQEDWPDPPPADALPLIDPDSIGPEDMVFAALTPQLPPFGQPRRTATQPIEFWEDRRDQIQYWFTAIKLAEADLQDPNNFPGAQDPKQIFEAFITDEAFSILNNRLIRLGVGLGLPLADFQDLRARRQAGENIDAELTAWNISQAAFDYLISLWEILNLNHPGVLLGSEWDNLYMILIQRLKRTKYADWRTEEKNRGFILSPEHFRLRTSPLSGGTEWHPKVWRADPEVRANWEDTLRTRVEQENAIKEGIRVAISEVENALLSSVRDQLIIYVSTPLGISDKAAWLTQLLQIDCKAGACQITTRTAQAIETIQGVLFGARHGLIEDGAFGLDAPSFDEEWQWIGSYAAWRAAMLVFLYPENAIRPILRREKSKPFQQLITDLQNKVPVSPDDGQKAAVQYTEYFRDICTLTPVAVYETGNWMRANVGPDPVGRGCLVIARGGSAKLYFAAFDQRPASGLSFVPSHTMWEEIRGLPLNSEVVGFLPFQREIDQIHIGLYTRSQQGGIQTLLFAEYNGTEWSTPKPISELPSLVATAEYRDGIIPADESLAAAGVNGWRLSGTDRMIPMYVEGFGSRHRVATLVIANQTENDGRRRVGILRGRDGGLILTAFTTIEGQWSPASDRPILIWRGGIQRLLLIRQDGPLAQLGLLGTNWPQGDALAIVWQTTDGFVGNPDGTSWQVTAIAPLVPAQLENALATSLLAIGYESTSDQLGWRDISTRVFVLQPSGEGFQLRTQFLLNNPYHEAPGVCASATHVNLKRMISIRLNGYEMLLGLGLHEHRYGPGADCSLIFYASVFAWETYWSLQAGRLNTRSIVPETNAATPIFALDRNDDFIAVSLPNGKEAALILPSGAHQDLATIAYSSSNTLHLTWQSVGAAIDPSSPSAIGAWAIRLDDQFMAAGGIKILAARADGSELGGIDVLDNTGKLGLSWRINNRVTAPGGTSGQGWNLARGAQFVRLDLDQDGASEILALAPDGRLGVLHAITPASFGQDPGQYLRNVGPVNVGEREILDRSSPRWLSDRKMQIETAYSLNESPSLRRYLDEAFFFVPMQIALRLRESGYYTAALDWLRSLYDYERPDAERKIAYRLVIDEQDQDPETLYLRAPDWVIDPVNPHVIAETRQFSYLKFTIMAIVGCLSDFGDVEFTRGTSESVPRARELYLEALELLDRPEIKQYLNGCSEEIGKLTLKIGEDEYIWVWQNILERLGSLRDLATLTATVDRIKAITETDDPLPDRLAAARIVVDEVQAGTKQQTIATLSEWNRESHQRAETALLADQGIRDTVQRLAFRSTDVQPLQLPLRLERIPAPSFGFCISPNRVIQAARRQVEMNLNKIRNCRNISGLEMQLDPYTLPTAGEAGLQTYSSMDRLPSFQRPALQPLPYRYSALIDRTKQLVQLAQQIESSMLDSLRSLGQAQYDALKARHDLMLAEAGVRLKDLQLVEANDGVDAAFLQRARAQLQSNQYRRLMNQGLSIAETAALGAMTAAVAAEFAGIYSPETFLEWFGAAAPAFGRLAELSTTAASYERRAEEWRNQAQLAAQDISIGQQQIQLAYDRVRISSQDRAIAALQVEHAETMLDFINTQKFGTPALYEWMSSVLEQVYRFFLQQATSMAQLAEAQLAFERQEILPAFIQADYWEPPANTNPPGMPGASTSASNVRGLTGSARLLQDIYELDQYAFRTDQRKLQLSETISLAQLDPIAFQMFRETGVLRFATPLSLFDRKFPGHYLRLVKRVRTSVIALIPPTQGVRATLATTGTSRVVIGGSTFQTVRIQRGPESVALTAPMNATGLFDLDTQPEMLVPFEGIGIDTAWEFSLPKPANQIDYGTIADVLITLDYTALNSTDYRQQVLGKLDPRFQADRPFSFRRDLADAWYDLHNPELVADDQQMVVRFRIENVDFPPNLVDPTIRHVVLYFAGSSAQLTHVENVRLTYTSDILDIAGNPVVASGDAKPLNGKISTRAGAWNSMIGKSLPGEWILSLRPEDNDPDINQKLEALKQMFKSKKKGERIEDILFVITYTGMLPSWPE